MNKHLLLVIALAAISLIAVSCTCGGFSEPQFNSPPGEPQPGEPMVFFGADRMNIQPGECATLDWRVEGEGFFGIELNGQSVDAFGHKQVCPPESTIYNLAIDVGNTVLRREVIIAVAGTGQPQPPTPPPSPPGPGQPPQQPQQSSPGCPGAPIFTHFNANPSFIVTGQSASLDWGPVTNGATSEMVGSVILTPGNFGEVGSPGSRQVSPATTTTYTLTATGCGGTATKTVTVSVGPPGGGSWGPTPTPSPTPPGGGSWSGPPKVTSVVAKANPSNYNGPCPKTVNMSADITTDGPCTVTYRWERIDGATGPVETLVFSAAGTKTVSSSWMIVVASNVTYWERVSILTPLPMISNQANFTITCTP